MRNEALSALEEISSRIMHTLKPYGIERLGVYYRNSRRRNHIAQDQDDDSWLADETGLEADAFDIDPDDLVGRYGGERAGAGSSCARKRRQPSGIFYCPGMALVPHQRLLAASTPSGAHRYAHI
ncbi:hypothetical protein SAMN05216178_7115 [Pseudomonas saponiphila]|uniref:Uncharacterized protein n=2 Tax=Pseudomonas saponiphila TaxID=556534 RepID=A0A1H5ALD4_9PSED|nr:hypothetical protein SAMN05216178_7115 [Pseudomonas saponiphila]